MKRFAKILTAACLTTFMIFSLTACNNEDGDSSENEKINIEGTWKKSVNKLTVTEQGFVVYDNYLKNNPVTWTVKSDGVVIIDTSSLNGESESITCSWTINDNKITVTNSSMPVDSQKTTYTYSREDGYIYFDDPSENYYRLEKQ